jgi:hypothetical protein
MKNSFRPIPLLLLVATGVISSCQSVKEYNKMYLNDAEMSLSARPAQRTEMNYLLYREGASGANGGKTGGGCGCN